jgi:hypothetical protein
MVFSPIAPIGSEAPVICGSSFLASRKVRPATSACLLLMSDPAPLHATQFAVSGHSVSSRCDAGRHDRIDGRFGSNRRRQADRVNDPICAPPVGTKTTFLVFSDIWALATRLSTVKAATAAPPLSMFGGHSQAPIELMICGPSRQLVSSRRQFDRSGTNFFGSDAKYNTIQAQRRTTSLYKNPPVRFRIIGSVDTLHLTTAGVEKKNDHVIANVPIPINEPSIDRTGINAPIARRPAVVNSIRPSR